MICSASSFSSTARSCRMRPITVQRTLVPPYRSRQAKLSSASDHADDEQENMVSVTLETANNSNTLHVQKGEILRTALLRRGTSPHNGRARLINCRGLGTCGTCAVEIDGVEGAMEPNQRNTKEQLRLNFPPHGSPNQSPNLRLACQVQVQGDITVRKRKGFWGQDSDELAEEYEAKLWFGDLEYIMDDKSPPKRN